MKILKKLTATALLLCMLTAMLVIPAAAAAPTILLTWGDNAANITTPLSGLVYLYEEIDHTTTYVKVAYSDGSTTDGNFTVNSDNTSVVAATTGTNDVFTIMPKGQGSATITVTSKTHASLSKTFDVTVLPPSIPVSLVTLNETTLSLTAGGATATLTATVSPNDATNKTLTWSNTDETIAMFDEATGTVTPLADGSTIITATANDGSGKSASCTVTVTAVPVITVTSTPDGWGRIDFSREDLTTGKEITLQATQDVAGGSGEYTWSAAPEGIISLTRGSYSSLYVIKPLQVGETIITVSRNGCTSATYPVKVYGVTALSLNPTTLTLAVGSTGTLAPTVSTIPAGGDKSVTWESNNTAVATVSNGIVTAVAPGTATITAASGGKSAAAEVQVTGVTGITLNATSLNLTTGSSSKLVPTVTTIPVNGDKSVTWSSDKPAVATVAADGTVSAVAPGTAIIIARAGGKSTTCTVTVNAPAVTTGTLSLAASPKSISAIGGYSELTASIPNGSGAQQAVSSDLVSWSIDTAASNGRATFSQVGNRVYLYGNAAGTMVVNGSYTANGVTYTGKINIGITPMLTYGNYSAYDGKNHMRFLTNEIYPGQPSRVNVVVDGYTLTHGMHCYIESAPNGYVMVTLNKAFLDYLNPAVVHTIQIGTPGNLATGYFRSYGHASSIYGVRTGDENQAGLWAALCIMSMLGAATILISRRKDWKV